MSDTLTIRCRVYSKTGCPSCESVKETLETRDIEFDVVDLSDDAARVRFYDERGFVGNDRRVPKVYELEGESESLIGGYEQTKTYLDALLG